jgi:hypothetical protein
VLTNADPMVDYSESKILQNPQNQVLRKIMRLEVYTKQGVFHGKSSEYDEKTYNEVLNFVKGLHEVDYLHFETDNGDTVYMTKGMINNSVFILRKNND